jgi:8-oxo-dGTP pyrophosphatase MutT (NUDIX family)
MDSSLLTHGPELRCMLEDHLSVFDVRRSSDAGLRRAAVAIVVGRGVAGEGVFVLTRRAAGLTRHGGQFALPGGRLDADETPEVAALRELREEVGLRVSERDVLGTLDDYMTRSGFVITPVVTWYDAVPDLRLDPKEVAWADCLPLAELLRPDAPRLSTIPESDRPVVSMPLAGTLVHAPTAAILYQLREVALLGRPTRVSHLDQPVFAWR